MPEGAVQFAFTVTVRFPQLSCGCVRTFVALDVGFAKYKMREFLLGVPVIRISIHLVYFADPYVWKSRYLQQRDKQES